MKLNYILYRILIILLLAIKIKIISISIKGSIRSIRIEIKIKTTIAFLVLLLLLIRLLLLKHIILITIITAVWRISAYTALRRGSSRTSCPRSGLGRRTCTRRTGDRCPSTAGYSFERLPAMRVTINRLAMYYDNNNDTV